MSCLLFYVTDTQHRIFTKNSNVTHCSISNLQLSSLDVHLERKKKNVYGEMKNTYLTVQNTIYKQKIRTTRPENYIKLGMFPDHAPETV